MENKEYGMNDIVILKKEHACHKSNQWQVVRMGADIKIKCLGCSTVVMLPRSKFNKALKKVIREER